MESSDKSKQVDWYVRNKTDVSITITFTASGVYNITGLTLACGIYNLNGDLVFSPAIVNGGVTGIATLSLTDTQTDLSGDQFFWKLATSTPIDLLLLQGIFQLNDYLWDGGVNTSNSVIVNINGTNVTLSISLS